MASRQSYVYFNREDNTLNQYASWFDNNWGNPWGSDIRYDNDFYGVPGNGVLMQDGWVTGSYNALNQPVAMWSPAFQGTPNHMWFGFDPLGRCVKRWIGPSPAVGLPPPETNPATYYYYDGWKSIDEGPGNGVSYRRSSFGDGPDEMLSTHNLVTNRLFYHHYDARGHCTLITDWSNGAIMEHYQYDAFGKPYVFGPFGQVLGDSSPAGNRFLFTGREWLKELRLYDYRHRLYQPELGRFMQPDPLGYAAGDPNLYRYCAGDPVNCTDPTGETPVYHPDDDYFTYIINPGLQRTQNGGYMGPSQECASGCQNWSGAPLVRYWRQGAPISSQTMIGTVIAKGWIDGRYPNFSEKKWEDYLAKNPGSNVPLNHAVFFLGLSQKKGWMWILQQYNGHPASIDLRPIDGYNEATVSRQNEVDHGGSRADGRGGGADGAAGAMADAIRTGGSFPYGVGWGYPIFGGNGMTGLQSTPYGTFGGVGVTGFIGGPVNWRIPIVKNK